MTAVLLQVTGLFAAGLGEKEQVALHTGWLVMFPAGVNIMQDRGFRLLQRFYPKYVDLVADSLYVPCPTIVVLGSPVPLRVAWCILDLQPQRADHPSCNGVGGAAPA